MATERALLLNFAPLDVLVDAYLDERAASVQEGTVRSIRSVLRRLAGALGDKPATALTAEALEAWLTADRRVTPSTLRARRTAIRAFTRWAVEGGHLPSDPAADVSIVRDPAPAPALSDRELLRTYRRWQEWRNLSRTTITAYAKVHRRWAAWLAERDRTLSSATKVDVEAFLDRDLSPRARYSYLSRLASLYGWAADEGLVDDDPTAKVRRPQLPQAVPHPIGTDDLRLALAGAPARTRAFLTLAAFAGLRCKEVAGVRVEDLRLHDDPPVLIVSAPKGLRQRVVPLHPDVLAALRRHGLPSSGYVFPYWGQPRRAIQPYTVSHEGNRYLHSLGIAETMHSLRSWFATSVYAESLDLRLTQELCGHADPSTTAGYAAVTPGKASDVVRALSLVPS